MSPKRLLPLMIILLVLGALAVLLKRTPPSVQLADEVGLERLVPQALRAEHINGFELYHGSKPQESVRLQKREGTWLVTSRFDTPGSSTKIQPFLSQLSTLQGELRADSPSLLGDFQITDEQALHLKVYTDAPDKPAVHLLAGKGSGSNGFMRRAGEGKVYSVNLYLQSTAGVSSSATEQVPNAKPWLDLRVQNVPKEQVTAVELFSPARTLRFTTPPAAPAASADATPSLSAPAAPAWQLAAPTMAYSVKAEAVESLVTTLRTLQADDVADPAHTASYGLDTPAYRAMLTLQSSGQEARQATLHIGNEVPEKGGSRYARLGDTGPVYVVPQWTVQRLSPTLGTVLHLRLLQMAQDDVMQVTFQEGSTSWSVERVAGEAPASDAALATWRLVEQPEATVDTSAMTTLLDTVDDLSADDLAARSLAEAGLEPPQMQLTFTLRDGRTSSVWLGQAVGQESSGSYARRGDAPDVFVLATVTHKNLTDAAAKLKPGNTAKP
ncbi:MAG: DUF4340 domain-containing protein [Candidatus Tectomicrobia bacterium]|uniref:DUF4340 domain-containing protein n=1 Tax=Tectimicrobiota bacterium TaxID=2528274 RepID=A0A937W480_UNCTE|nr:DUF4340 domain-containing protein [Candidatus Tectomicrobia bacterium]